ncbi:class A beta-lactamase-related serine hydrolase [Mesobacillus subterraneus]|uniref:serine hydrolase n=1 Tax=Mesobacillus subterraneus TaxID=285983 RepID=UPI00203C437E|nr:serine hydrolase [Mesobacillus subterraneus]MCM3665025.1 class A beta-lactamase-related serine hydrolase [Mesobacillus subterraneus]MCM3682112.1 class A beta-lactamase-related serine hydrolase [Mesobacillus subterraneus]
MNIQNLKDNVYKELARCKGRASLFMEIEDHVIEFNSHDAYRSASLIKIPILFEALRQIEKGIISADADVSLRITDKVGDTGVLQALSCHKYSIQDLLTLMIIVSDNSATNLLIDMLGIETINSTIRRLGMSNTVMHRKMLDFDSINSGKDNFTSAADMVACLKEGIDGSLLKFESRDRFHSILLHQQFKEKLPAYIDETLINAGNKTGELPGLEHDCAVFSYGDRKAFVAVLIDGLAEAENGKYTIRQIGKQVNTFISANLTRFNHE